MDKITEIIYLPSLRCNLNCKHCGENQDIPREQELDCARVLEQIAGSLLLEDMTISVSGGEPFLNPGMGGFIRGILRRTRHRISITTNGYFTNEIIAAIEPLTAAEKARVEFAISIDGLRDTHNAIRRNPYSFDRAMETVRYLAGQNVAIDINTVVQPDNLNELEPMQALFAGISPAIRQACVPISLELSEKKEDHALYTEEYLQAVWRRAPENNVIWKRILLSHSQGRIRRCHAGRKNIVIAADGKVYACLTAPFYHDRAHRADFMLGDLRTQTLDEILCDTARREEVCSGAVTQCAGCVSHCELDREWLYFGMGGNILPEEVPTALRLEKDHRIGDALLDYAGWYAIERDAADPAHAWCWSRDLTARAFVPTAPGGGYRAAPRLFQDRARAAREGPFGRQGGLYRPGGAAGGRCRAAAPRGRGGVRHRDLHSGSPVPTL